MALRIATPIIREEKLLVNNWNLPASTAVYVRADCATHSPGTSALDWRVKANKASTILAYQSRDIANTGTITLADATNVDDGDTFFLNGVAITAEATEGDATGNKYFIAANNTLTAANVAACINANVPGVLATSAARVVTVVPSGTSPAATLLFQLAANGAGTQAADANECAWADGTLANLIKDSKFSQVTGSDNSATSGTNYSQYADGWPYCYLGYTDTSAAITALTVGVTTHESL